MINGYTRIYTFYLYVSIVFLLPIAVILKQHDERLVWKSAEQLQHLHIDLRNSTNYEKQFKDLHLSVEDAGDRIFTLAETLGRMFFEFEELFESVLNIMTTNIPKITRDAENFVEKLSNQTVNILSSLSNRLFSEGDDFLGEMLRNFEHQLESVSLEFQNLATTIDEHFNFAVTQLNLTLINNTGEYDWWTAHVKQKLRNLNDTKLYQEGCRAIDAFISNSTQELHNCCKITMKPMRSLCKSASSLITEALNTIVDSVDRMQLCLEEKKSYLDFMLPCINVAYEEITALVSRAAQITHQINNMLPMKIIYTRSCFAIVKVDMNFQRKDIEANIFSY